MQIFARFIAGPIVMMIAHTGIDGGAVGQINAANSGIMSNLVIEFGKFLLIIFESTHAYRIR